MGSAAPLLALLLLAVAWSSASALTPAPRDLPAPLPPALPVVPGLNSDFLDDRSAEDFASAAHDHDGRYYTEAESDARFAAAAHIHDDRYYTESEADATFAAAGHDHDGRYALLDHDHDGDYLPAGAAAADADRLDGLDSAAFLQRAGLTVCTVSNATRAGVNGWNALHWQAANCTNGLPLATCVGMLARASAFGNDEDWAVLLPGESAPFSGTFFPTGGVQYWLSSAGSGTYVRAVYLC